MVANSRLVMSQTSDTIATSNLNPTMQVPASTHGQRPRG